MTAKVVCPHCGEETEVWLGGDANLFDCSACGQAFSYAVEKPLPPPPISLPAIQGQVEVTHATAPVRFWPIFKVIFFIAAGLGLTVFLILAAFGFLGGAMGAAAGYAKAKTHVEKHGTGQWFDDPLSGGEVHSAKLALASAAIDYDEFEKLWEINYAFDFDHEFVSMYVVKDGNGPPVLRLFANSPQIIEIENVIFRVGEETYRIDSVSGRPNFARKTEYCAAGMDEYSNLVLAFATNTVGAIKVRLDGASGNHDFTVPDEQVKQCQNSILAYLYLRQNPDAFKSLRPQGK